MKSLAEFSVRNPLLVHLVSLLFAVTGLYAVFRLLNREAFPNISFDVVSVSTTYPGSTPEEVEKLITIPIEKELKQVDDIEEMTSVSAEGISRISLTIDEDARDKRGVVNDIQRAVERVEDLPADLADKPLVTEMRTKDNPVIEVALWGELTEAELRRHALAIEKRLETLPDVSKIARKGYRKRQIAVEVSPESVSENYVSLGELAVALKSQNRAIPGGKLYDEESREFILRTTGQFTGAGDVAETVVRAGALGKWVRVKDVADVKEDFEEETTIEKTRGRRSITLVVVKKEKGDAIRLVEETRARVDEYVRSAGGPLQVSYVNDMSYYIKRRLNVLVNNGCIGLVMVAVSLFLFLSPGTALSACLGIPTALLMTFTFMGIFGISINLISLFGLIMVLGMLVDEDIVMSENVHRHLEEGMPRDEAVVRGAREVGAAIVVTVSTTIAAFVPLFFMGGIMGKFTRNIPMVVSITLACSLAEALIILPAHLKKLGSVPRPAGGDRPVQRGARLYGVALKAYRRVLDHGLRRRYAYTAILLAVFGASLALALSHMKFILFPRKGIEMFFVRAEGELGDSLERTEQNIRILEKVVETIPPEELDTYTTLVGVTRNDPNDPFTERASHVSQIQVFLTPEAGRTRTSVEIADSLRPLAVEVKGFSKITIEQFRNGPPVGKPVQVSVRGEDFAVLRRIADEYKSALSKIAGVSDVEDSLDAGKNERRVAVDAVRAAQAGLTVEGVAGAVRQAFEGETATSIKTTEEEIDVVVRLKGRHEAGGKALETLKVPNARGQLVPISRVAGFTGARGLQAIRHLDGERVIDVTANVDEHRVSAVEVMRRLEEDVRDETGRSPDYRVSFGGEVEDTQKSLHNLFFAFIFAAGLILLILVAMFKSLMQTFAVMFTIPFSVIGVILAFMAHGLPLSFMALLGLVALTGIVVDGATIMIDFINRFRADGMERRASILEGSALRLRAVTLTTVTTVAGVFPSSYGIGGSDPFIAPMALALNYGIIFSTALTLFYLPIFIAIIDDLKGCFRFPRKAGFPPRAV